MYNNIYYTYCLRICSSSCRKNSFSIRLFPTLSHRPVTKADEQDLIGQLRESEKYLPRLAWLHLSHTGCR